jgi:hypothetical protein
LPPGSGIISSVPDLFSPGGSSSTVYLSQSSESHLEFLVTKGERVWEKKSVKRRVYRRSPESALTRSTFPPAPLVTKFAYVARAPRTRRRLVLTGAREENNVLYEHEQPYGDRKLLPQNRATGWISRTRYINLTQVVVKLSVFE